MSDILSHAEDEKSASDHRYAENTEAASTILAKNQDSYKLAQFATFLIKNGYMDLRFLPGNRWAGLYQFAFTGAIIAGTIYDWCGTDDRWCFCDLQAARNALQQWNGEGEPEGWHRHPASGRRRPNGDATLEYVAR